KYSISRIRHRDANLWQRRFWEHQIRDQEDFNRHCDYIHYNPVKHGLVGDPKKWEYSTIHRFIRKGLYSNHWGDFITDDIISMDME
ncbi:transposase, partial [candidate division WOR-3 bacterium]|nr:transposase [candidate division WOR-3 bacterium]